MNPQETDKRVCDQCGASLAQHTREGLCSRCVARFSLLEPEPEELGPALSDQSSVTSHQSPGTRDQKSEVGGQRSAVEVKARFGDYELLEEIAHGGMGVVYRARQISLKRVVALKMMLCGQFAGKAAFERFRAEAETTAKLQHQNIVAIHGIGESDGQPYFSMDYVAGRNLAEIVRDHPLPAQQAAGYLRKVALAVHYAHTQGVLHRDLKPANVLIDENDEPRVTDFGLAKRLTDSQPTVRHSLGEGGSTPHSPSAIALAKTDQLTLSGQLVGSPNFMPPEQGMGRKVKLSPASDVYGLGALLYYLLTARPPFVAETFEATLAQVLNTDPVNPRQLNPGLPLDLETICLKCLEKDPARRYQSAQELADELDRFLKGEPIHARPIGLLGKGWRWCRRKPAMAGMAAGLILTLATGLAAVLSQWRRAEASAVRERTLADVRLRERYAADMAVVGSRIQEGNLDLARNRLSQYMPKAGEVDLRGFEWHLFHHLTQGDQVRTIDGLGEIRHIVALKSRSLLATAGQQPGVTLVDPATGRRLIQLPTACDQVCSLALSPDERLLAVGSDPAVYPTGSDRGVAEVWDLAAGQVVAVLKAPAPRITFSPVDELAAIGSGGEVVGGTRGEVLLWEFRKPGSSPESLPESGGRAVFSPDGKVLVTGLHNMQLVAWDVASRQPIARLGVTSRLLEMVFSPTGEVLATAHDDGTVQLWDIVGKRSLGALRGHSLRAIAMAFLKGGALLVSASPDQTVCFWDVQQQKKLFKQNGVVAFQALAVLDQGTNVVTGCCTGRLDFWKALPDSGASILEGIQAMAFSPDGKWILCLSTNRNLHVLEAATLRPAKIISNSVSPTTLEANRGRECSAYLLGYIQGGRRFATVDYLDHSLELVRLRFWNAQDHLAEREVAVRQPKDLIRRGTTLSPDGRFLAAGGINGEVVVWSTETGEVLRIFRDQSKQVFTVVFSPDSRVLASNSDDRSVVLRDVSSWQILHQFKASLGLNSGVFSQDGGLYAASCWDRFTYVWNVREGTLKGKFEGHRASVRSVAFSPNGKTIATGADDFTVRFWDLATGREMGYVENGGYVLGLEFNPSGDTLAARIIGERDRWVRLWSASTVTKEVIEVR